jgi:DNA replicative helicase MCM subunit Mcm2 (Cdc46/Mcm family)
LTVQSYFLFKFVPLNKIVYCQILSQDMLKKYITYAKLNVFPKIHDADLDKISHVYAELRRESSVSQTLVVVLSNTVMLKHLETYILENQ